MIVSILELILCSVNLAESKYVVEDNFSVKGVAEAGCRIVKKDREVKVHNHSLHRPAFGLQFKVVLNESL